MASFHYPLFLFFSLFLLLQPHSVRANLHRTKTLLKNSNRYGSELLTVNLKDTTPTRYFEVTKPIKLPNTKPCSHLVLHHDLAYTYRKPPVAANYTPPSHCSAQKFSKIVLEWNATCKGRQFDRIFGVWLGGVELLRSCTAEPRPNGIVWTVEKDVTRYYSLLVKNETQTLTVYIGNLIDRTYNGVYHVDITFHFYPAEENLNDRKYDLDNMVSGYGSEADLILPISRNLPLEDGLWFKIENSTDSGVKEFEVPRNTYRAVLEVYVSFHESDEFWYGNLPNDYIAENNLTDYPGNGPFREVVVSLDNDVVGAVWPFTVVYTGGINPLLWRPITGIGSFNLPSYDIEITPFLGNILDGKSHTVGFSVINALNVWYIDANLHLWLDSKSSKTEGKLLKLNSMPHNVSLVSNFTGFNGTFLTNVNRYISSTGWVESSHGKVTTQFIQEFAYSNTMVMSNDANLQIVNQTIHFNDSVFAEMPSSNTHFVKSFKTFPFYLYSNYDDRGNGTSLSVANVTLGFNEKNSKNAGSGFTNSSLKNLHDGHGVMVVRNNLVVSGLGSTQQVYNYHGDEFSYFRNISSSNYTILHDEVRYKCDKTSESHLGSSLEKNKRIKASTR